MSEPDAQNTAASASPSAAARAAVRISFKNPELPIAERREDVLRALGERQVIIVAGDTGSGKSTQLPQYCLQAGRGTAGLIAHTQPRRLAARALAARIAEELSQPVGMSVGFKVRFADQTSAATRLLLMTDGLLLAELTADPDLRRYDTIVVDEAHERSLNVDLLLGVLKRLLPRRPDLKLIVTSATLDVERFARFFDDAPIIAVSGRAHPIELRYQSAPQDAEDPDLPLAVYAAYQQIAAESGAVGKGDVLVFLPGEREIRDVGEFLERELPQCEVLPLYSRLSWEQQSRIFLRGARQRIVLATNVAETSITVPGIRSVIDSGLARISRYSLRNRLQRLPIEPVARASAEQRKGRCGRLGPGLCIRLYAQTDFESRPWFTEPEILRTNLAALLLRLAADRLGDAESFPFIDAPDTRALNDGYRLLQELQALDAERRITRRGRAMAGLPLDPRLARALLESQRFHAESELLAIVSGLSVPDARIRDPAMEAAAETGFQDARSEFSGLIKLWRAYRKMRDGTRRELRAWCKQQRFSLLRLSEWEDVHTQTVQRARELGIAPRGWSASYAGVHRALLAGFCTMVGVRGEQGEYSGTRGGHFHLLPGSALARRKPRWVMAANIVETSRVFARRVAQIEPAWIESAAAHILKREYLEPDWDDEREEVAARERVGLLGLIVSANRVVNYGPIAPEAARRIFAREALVHRRLRRRPDWLLDADAAIDSALRIEERLRTRGLLLGAEAFVDFYDRNLPRQVSSAAGLEHFNRHLTAARRDALRLRPEDIFARRPEPAALAQFPESAALQSLTLPVEYRFAPGEPADGATVRVPLLSLPGMTGASLRNAIPGFALPRIEALLRSLPKDARRRLIPVAETAKAFIGAAGSGAGDLDTLKSWLVEQYGLNEAQAKLDPAAVPRHLLAQISVNLAGRELACGEYLPALRRRCAAAACAEIQRLSRSMYAGVWRKFEPEHLPASVSVALGTEGEIVLFPSLQPTPQGLRQELTWSAEEAAEQWHDSAPRLARMMLPAQQRDLAKALAANGQLLLRASAYFSGEQLSECLLQLAFRDACFGAQPAPRSRAAFEAAVEQGRTHLAAAMDLHAGMLSGWLTDAAELRRAWDDARVASMGAAVAESRLHLRRLLSAAELQAAPAVWLRQIARYLKAEQRRWQRNAARGSEPDSVLQQLRHWQERLAQLQLQVSAELRSLPRLHELRYWIEEFRVSSYAQELKTLGPISASRLQQRDAEIEAWLRR